MKTYKPLLFLLLTIVATACTSDDTPTPTVNIEAQMLVGTWNLTEINQEGTATTPAIPVNGTVTSFGKDIDAQITFTETPSNFMATGGYTEVFSVSIVGQPYTDELAISFDQVLNQGTWSVSNGVLSLGQGGQVQDVRVTQLNNTSLKIEVDIEESVTLEGVSITVSTTAKMTLSKQ